MKKFAFAILSVFMILGGMVLSACEKNVSLSVSATEVTLYTNDTQQNLSREIEVTLEGSSDGIDVEELDGNECITLEKTFTESPKRSGKYAFVVKADLATQVQPATIKVSSKEDPTKYQFVYVTVNTLLTGLNEVKDDRPDSRTNNFVVKGVDKELVVGQYFSFEPITANICDIIWTFEDSQTDEWVVDGQVYGVIENGKLKVSEDCQARKVVLRATFARNSAVSNVVELNVLDNATIDTYSIEHEVFYENGEATDKTSATFQLKRNDDYRSKIEGSFVVNTSYNLQLDPVIYKVERSGLVEVDFEEYFSWEKYTNPIAGGVEYNFVVNAYTEKTTLDGDFYFYLKVGYADYNYDFVIDDVSVLLDTAYVAKTVDIQNKKGDSLANSLVDVFSDYTGEEGFSVKAIIGPDDVVLEDSRFYIAVDLTQQALAEKQGLLPAENPLGAVFNVKVGENFLNFAPISAGSHIYVTENISSMHNVFITAADIFDVFENVELKFVSSSNQNAYAKVSMNFYKISTDAELTVVTAEDEEVAEDTFISSSAISSREVTYRIKLKNLTTKAGLELKYGNAVAGSNADKFEFSPLYLKSVVSDGDEDYIIVEFTVTLKELNFEGSTKFWFEHITGKKSGSFNIHSFVPLSYASLMNADKASMDIYVDQIADQNYVLAGGVIEESDAIVDSSLSKIMLEAGSSAVLSTNYRRATLTEAGVEFKYLSYDQFINAVKIAESIVEDKDAQVRANEIFTENQLSLIASQYYIYFQNLDGMYFQLTPEKLTLTDNEFRGYVAVLVNGFDEDHEAFTLARFFALESFYPAKFMKSNISTATLYTTETLSISDMARSYRDVRITFRSDEKIPTYTDKISYFTFEPTIQNFGYVSADGTYYENDYYSVGRIAVEQDGKVLTFRITANSTNLQTSVRETLVVYYEDDNGLRRSAEIQIEIRNENRVESVRWLNRTIDDEIYLNLTGDITEKNFTIATSVAPSSANDLSLQAYYFATGGGSSADLNVLASASGQSFNLTINTTTGGSGYIYLLPTDMIKEVQGIEHVLVYKYDEVGGKIVETAKYIRVSELVSNYDAIINGSEEYSNYFYNNSGEKIYYSELIVRIAITIADGESEGTAIRVYNQGDLEKIDTAKYYRVMNDIVLTNWTAYETLSGMIYGNEPTVTLTMAGTSEEFVKTLSGVVKDLTFAGNVVVTEGRVGGFVANINTGTISNVKLDVAYVGGKYVPSIISAPNADTAVGGLVGSNQGTIKDCFVYGASISGANAGYAGGIAGQNFGRIEGSGYELYKFETENTTIFAKGNVGGIAGYAGAGSWILKSYMYAYSLTDPDDLAAVDAYKTIFIAQEGKVGAFTAGHVTDTKIEQSFAFAGDLEAPTHSSETDNFVSVVNSYLTYYRTDAFVSRVFKDTKFAYTYDYLGGSNGMGSWVSGFDTYVAGLDGNIWQKEEIEPEVNFGIVHLKDAKQTIAVEIDTVKFADVKDPLQVLEAEDGTKAILFVYQPVLNVVDEREKMILNQYNTISKADLFGVTEKQASTLLVSTTCQDVVISANSIRLLRENLDEFVLTVHSKMDFTQSLDFNVVIANVLPTLATTLEENPIKNNQTILLQNGKTRNVIYNYSSSIYLNGTDVPYELQTDKADYAIAYEELEDSEKEFLSIQKTSNSLVFKGIKASEAVSIDINSHVKMNALAEEYATEIAEELEKSYKIKVYDGATALIIEDASDLEIKPSDHGSFDVTIVTDNADDGLVFDMTYGQITLKGEEVDDNVVEYKLDSKVTLEVYWTKISEVGATSKTMTYAVVVKIKNDCKHLVEQIYEDIVLSVNAISQSENDAYRKSINVKVLTQSVDTISIATYKIANRRIRNSVLYFNPEDVITSVLKPSSDAIVAVNVTPAYAKMTHFTLTYSVSGKSVGTVSLSKLSYAMYGYYTDTENTVLLTNGILVNLTEEDKQGTGEFFFRLYLSSAFADDSDLTLTLTYYYEDQVLKTGTSTMSVAYMPDADIVVKGDLEDEGQTTYMLAKGESVYVEVTLGADQSLYGIYLQNNGANITLSTPELVSDPTAKYQVYRAKIRAGVNALLGDGSTTGIFYVCASVQKIENGVAETKVSRATLCLVDFAVDANKIKVVASGSTMAYNGRVYDVYRTYLNDTQYLTFDYPFTPEEYNYDKTNASEYKAVADLTAKRNQFKLQNNFRDDNCGYYINHRFDEQTGAFNALSLKQQLSYASNENSWSAIYNPNNGIADNRYFTISTTYVNGMEMLQVTGKQSGTQLMRLETTVNYQGIEMVVPYYFLIVVEVYSDEDLPTQISSAEQFEKLLKNSAEPDDYILMKDIVLTNWTPFDTTKVNSLDGNGYTIHINSFAMPKGSTVQLALFTEVTTNTTLKNVRVNIYNGGQISVDITQYETVDIAGFAITNSGIIYNCEVVASYDNSYQSSALANNFGLVVKYALGENADDSYLTSSSGVTSRVAGFVIENASSITNSRVGGNEYSHIIVTNGTSYITTTPLDKFTIRAQGEVAGFVHTNTGYISASFAKKVEILNYMQSVQSLTAGFALYNTNSIQGSYVEGVAGEVTPNGKNVYNNGSKITAIGTIAGFVYDNTKLVKNSYANIAIEHDKVKAASVAGFVYKNGAEATVTLCYSACEISTTDINEMPFSGAERSESLNQGEISLSYYYNNSSSDTTIQSKLVKGALGINEYDEQETFYGFSFSSQEGAYDGIWEMTDGGVSLVSANQIAMSSRYAVTNGDDISIFYNKSIMDLSDYTMKNLAYGSENNPIIIRSEQEFAQATGKATAKEISSYKEYYDDDSVDGHYRIVFDLDMDNIDQNAEGESSIKLTTTKKTFTGLLDGNGFKISNINLGSNEACENYGLFAKFDGAIVVNMDLTVNSIHNAKASIVGALAGTAVDSRILSINVQPVETKDSTGATAIQGRNVVGGVVGMLFGDSRLSDITLTNIVVEATNKVNGTIETNRAFVGKDLRNAVESKNILTDKVSNISYAGGVAGYVDIYRTLNSEPAKFSTDIDVTQFNVVTIRVKNSVDIYASVAGGLFGYVGESTAVYDANIELNAPQTAVASKSASYIAAKNLYAGGLIGESYGGLFAVYASYTPQLQADIETRENVYYNGTAEVERGQMSIFSYTEADKHYESRQSNPLFVGGLVGYMGGGYIYVGYNRLNVVSYSTETLAVGGVVGYAGVVANQFDLMFINNTPKTNILLNDVYASGDVAVVNGSGVAAGLVGALEATEFVSAADAFTYISTVALKNVMATNYYAHQNGKLLGDGEVTSISDKHFMLVGGVYGYKTVGSDRKLVAQTTNLKSRYNLYLIDAEDCAYNVGDGSQTSEISGALSVGGYSNVWVGATNYTINPFGFESQVKERSCLNATSISDKTSMATMSQAYAVLSRYFVPNGWADEFWDHEMDRLFPTIELFPKTSIIFWDYFNTAEVMAAVIENPSITVVVRGKLNNDENNMSCQDVEVTWGGETGVSRELLNRFLNVEFAGTLVSYAKYANATDLGYVTGEVSDGGRVGDKVGVILHSSMFKKLSSATIRDLNFYMAGSIKFESEDLTKVNEIGYSIIEEDAITSSFEDVRFVLNYEVYLEATKSAALNYTSENVSKMAGLVVGKIAESTSFSGIEFVARAREGIENGVTFKYENPVLENNEAAYIGLLAGIIEQNQTYIPMLVSSIKFTRESYTSDEERYEIKFDMSYSRKEGFGSEIKASAYVGVYAGLITKVSSDNAKLTLELEPLNNVQLTIVKGDASFLPDNLYVGGYAAKTKFADAISMIAVSEEDSYQGENIGINIKLPKEVENAALGLGFGELDNCDANISSTGATRVAVEGSVFGTENQLLFAGENVALGGFAGQVLAPSQNQIVVSNIDINFRLANTEVNATSLQATKEEYASHKETYLTKPVVFSNEQPAVGGLFGNITQAKVTIAGMISVDGLIDVQSSKNKGVLNVGGVIGRFDSELETLDNLNCTNDIDISIKAGDGQAVANIGGMIGLITETAGNITMQSSEINGQYYKYEGTLVSNVDGTLNYGGLVGNIAYSEVSSDREIKIANAITGNALKVYNTFDKADVNVGGIIGAFTKIGSSAATTGGKTVIVENCLSYGDVFVNYPANTDKALKSYYFGGIVARTVDMTISKCVSLMTNFNARPSNTTESNHIINIGPFVALQEGTVAYAGNKYSSQVTLCYEDEADKLAGVEDCGYGADGLYKGYSVGEMKKDAAASAAGAHDIFESLAVFNIDRDKLVMGHKLNPKTFSVKISADGKDFDGNGKMDNHFNNVAWVVVKEDLNVGDVIADNLDNMVVVGNGTTFTRTDDERVSVADNGANTMAIKGGLAHKMGNGEELSFSVISGFVANLKISEADINKHASATTAQRGVYGGVVGKMEGNAILYAVGVKGELSVGGTTQLTLGGISGLTESGAIIECYQDVDMTYRAAEGGHAAGITTYMAGYTFTRNVYSSGRIETYTAVDIYTFANVNGYAATQKNYILDSYSISQILRNGNAAKSSTVGDFFLRTSDGANTIASRIKNVLNYSSGTQSTNTGANADGTVSTETASLTFADLENGKRVFSLNPSDTAPETQYAWYFSPFVNYGYGVHGFDFLKNVTTYKQTTIDIPTTDDDGNDITVEGVGYQVLSVDEIVTEFFKKSCTLPTGSGINTWYMQIPNAAKYDEMIATVTTGSSYTYNYKFILRYDIDASQLASSKSNITVLNKTAFDFALDGNNKTLDYTNVTSGMSNGIFAEFYGTLSNIHIANINVTASGTIAGTVANKLNGLLENVSVVGNLSSTKDDATAAYGGVVGVIDSASAKISKVRSAVNVTARGGAIGGLVGALQNGEITNSSSAGAVVAVTHSNIEVDAGGIAGSRAAVSNINKTYNTGMVVANYTEDRNTTSAAYAGGIVGKSASGANTYGLTECYNTGFVGAGNYKSEGLNVAGGIFGYADGIKVTGCANDGAVQALGKRPDGSNTANYSISATTSGTANQGYTNTPGDYSVAYELTYNPGKQRQVYAYGIGWTSSEHTSTISNTSSSTDNVKNDGNIGEYKVSSTMTFGRQQMLDATSSKRFWGKFDKYEFASTDKGTGDKTYRINGTDSFGFPTRIYGIDVVQRKYASEGDQNSNEISQDANDGEVREFVYKAKFAYSGGSYQSGSSSIYSTGRRWIFGGGSGTDFEYAADDFTMPGSGSIQYFAEAEFMSYDDVLYTVNETANGSYTYAENPYIGLAVLKAKRADKIQSYTSDSFLKPANRTDDSGNKQENDAYIAEKVAEIEKAIKSLEAEKTITVAGKKINIVSNANQVDAMYNGYKYDVEIEFTLPENVSTYSNLAITFDRVTSVNPNTALYSRNIYNGYTKSGKKIIAKYTVCFMSEVTSFNVEASLSYSKTGGSVTLGENNVFNKGGKTYILFKENSDNNATINKEFVDTYNRYVTNGESTNDIPLGKMWYTNLKVKLESTGEELENYALKYSEAGIEGHQQVSYLEFNSTLGDDMQIANKFNGKKLVVVYDENWKVQTRVESVFSTTAPNVVNDTYSAGSYVAEFANYVKSSITGAGISVENYINSWASLKSVAGITATNFAFGWDDNHYFTIEGGTAKCSTAITNTYVTPGIITFNSTGVQINSAPSAAKTEFIDRINSSDFVYAVDDWNGNKSMNLVNQKTSDSDAQTKGGFKIEDFATVSARTDISGGYVTVSSSGGYITEVKYTSTGTELNAMSSGNKVVVVSSGAKFGLSSTKNISVTLDMTRRTEITATNEESLGFTITQKSSSNATKDYVQTYYDRTATPKKYTFNDIAIGDKFEISYVKTTIGGQWKNGVDKLPGSDVMLELSYIERDDDGEVDFAKNYALAYSTEATLSFASNEIDDWISGKKYISTSVQYINKDALVANTMYEYNYRIYENGVISVAYMYNGVPETENAVKHNTDKLEKSVMYVTNGSKMYKATATSLKTTYFDPEENKNMDVPSAYEACNWGENLKNASVVAFNASYLNGKPEFGTTKAIDVDLIAGGWSENSINLIRNSIDGGGSLERNFTQLQTKDNERSLKQNLVAGQSKEFRLNLPSGHALTANSFEYNKRGSQDVKSSDGKIVHSGINETVYQYSYDATFTKNTAISCASSGEEREVFDKMMLANNVYINGNISTTNIFEIIGQNKIIAFSSNSEQSSLFDTNNQNIENLIVVGSSSLRSRINNSRPEFYLLLGGQGSAVTTLNNVSLYGNIRNAKHNIGITVGAVSGSDKLAYKELKSNVAVSGLSAAFKSSIDAGDSVTTKLIDNVSLAAEESYTAKNLLIAGDAGSAKNGVAGKISTDGSERNGQAGKSGGAGGTVDVGASQSTSIARAGKGGFAGYGGSGVNGYVDNSSGYVIRDGGTAGAAGANGANGSTGSAVALEAPGPRAKVYSGLTGAGGFGYIAPSSDVNRYYAASNNDTSKIPASGAWMVENGNGMSYGAVSQHGLHSASSASKTGDATGHMFPNGFQKWKWTWLGTAVFCQEVIDAWVANVNAELSASSSLGNERMVYMFIEGAGNLPIIFGYVRANWEKGEKVLWSSGDYINMTRSFEVPSDYHS